MSRVAGMNKFRRTGKDGVLCAPGGTLTAASTLENIGLAEFMLSYLCVCTCLGESMRLCSMLLSAAANTLRVGVN